MLAAKELAESAAAAVAKSRKVTSESFSVYGSISVLTLV